MTEPPVAQPSRTESLLLELNKSGLSYLTHQQFPQSFQYFKQAQKIINAELAIAPDDVQVNRLAGITYNNLACYYKKTNKPKIALIYLQRALEVEVKRVEDWGATASTHLNICAIYSYLKQHQPAAKHAELALTMLSKVQHPDLPLSSSPLSPSPSQKPLTLEQQKSIQNLTMLSHYNLAIQLQHLKRFEPAIEHFSKARQHAKKIGKKNTGIIMVCDQSIKRLRETMDQMKEKLVKLVMRKREEEQKGHYYFMRRNKRNMGLGVARERERERAVQSTSLVGRIKQLRVYQQKPAHYRTKSIIRLKTTPKVNESNELAELGTKNRQTYTNLKQLSKQRQLQRQRQRQKQRSVQKQKQRQRQKIRQNREIQKYKESTNNFRRNRNSSSFSQI